AGRAGREARAVRAIAAQGAAVVREERAAVGAGPDWRRQIAAVRLAVDQDRARALGVSTESVGATLQAHFSGIPVGQYREQNKLIPILWRGDPVERRRIDSIESVYVRSASGDAIPLSQLVRPKAEFEEGVIWRRG